MLSPIASQRIKLLRFPLIVGVVLIHSYGSTVTVDGAQLGLAAPAPWLDFIRNFISNGVAQVSVPLLFLLAGFLFFLGLDGSRRTWQRKLQGRIHSLVIPYAFWNLGTLALFILLPRLPGFQGVFPARLSAAGLGPAELGRYFLGWGQNPPMGPFWFIRDLILCVLVTPLLFAALKPSWPWALLVVAALCVMGAPLIDLLFFSIGAYSARFDDGLFSFDRAWPWLLLPYLAALTLDALWPGEAIGLEAHKLSLALGMPLGLAGTACLPRWPRLAAWLEARCAGPAFFVFASHWLVLALAQKLAYKLVQPQSSMAILGLYLALPTAVIGLLLMLYAALERLAPRAAQVITGGRG